MTSSSRLWILCTVTLVLVSSLPCATAQTTWLSTPYETCRKALLHEGFASLSLDETSATNYPGSTVWIENGAPDFPDEFFVKGKGWICVNGTQTTDPRLAPHQCSNQPPLALNQCVPYPSLYFAAVYFAVGLPLFLACIILVHNWHREILQYRSNESCVGWCHPIFKSWTFLFSSASSQSPYYSSSLIALLIRQLELTHSFLCFFFISRSDRFGWKNRALTLLLEQFLNFAIQSFWTIQLYASGANPESNSGTLVVVVVTVATCSALSILLPVRRVFAAMRRREHDGVRLALKIWCILSIVIILTIGIIALYFTGNGGKAKGGQAPNPGNGLLLYSFLAYVAAIPYHFLLELVTNVAPIVFCCCLPVKYFTKQWTDEYTREFCMDQNGQVVIHDQTAEKGKGKGQTVKMIVAEVSSSDMPRTSTSSTHVQSIQLQPTGPGAVYMVAGFPNQSESPDAVVALPLQRMLSDAEIVQQQPDAPPAAKIPSYERWESQTPQTHQAMQAWKADVIQRAQQ